MRCCQLCMCLLCLLFAAVVCKLQGGSLWGDETDVYVFSTCLYAVVSDLQGASYLLVYVRYPAACSLFEAGLQLSIVYICYSLSSQYVVSIFSIIYL